MYPTHSLLSWAFTALPEIISSRRYEFCRIKRKGPIIIEFNVQTQCQRAYWVCNAERSVRMKISKVPSALTLSGTEKGLQGRTGSRETSSGCTLVRSPPAAHVRETAGRVSLVVSLPMMQDFCFYIKFFFIVVFFIKLFALPQTTLLMSPSFSLGNREPNMGPHKKVIVVKPPAFWWIPN